VEDFLRRHSVGFRGSKYYCVEWVCMSLKQNSFVLLMKLDVAVCYS
jgi:hypothetical protein